MTKRLIFSCFCLISSFLTYSQESAQCFTFENLDHSTNQKKNLGSIDGLTTYGPQCDRGINDDRIEYGAINLPVVIAFDPNSWNESDANIVFEDARTILSSYGFEFNLIEIASQNISSDINLSANSDCVMANNICLDQFRMDILNNSGLDPNAILIIFIDGITSGVNNPSGFAITPWPLVSTHNFSQRLLFVSNAFDNSYRSRTLVHEVGHSLGLYHTFKDIPNSIIDSCGEGDLISDTPNYLQADGIALEDNICECLNQNINHTSCDPYSEIEREVLCNNFMSYSDNQSNFTDLQILKMKDILVENHEAFDQICPDLERPILQIENQVRDPYTVYKCAYGHEFLVQSLFESAISNSNTNNICTWYYVNVAEYEAGTIGSIEDLPSITGNSAEVITGLGNQNIITNNKFSLGVGRHLIVFRDEAPYNPNCSSEKVAFAIIVTDENEACEGYSSFGNYKNHILKSLSGISNVTANVSCNLNSYNTEINFDAATEGDYSIIADDGSNIYSQLNNASPNSSNTIFNIPSNKTLFINVIDNNISSCQYNHIIVNKDLCIHSSNSLTHSCSINPSTIAPNQQVSVSGTATYDNGNPMINGTVSINYAGNSINTITDENGQYTGTITASNSSGTVSVSVSDGTFTNTCPNTLIIQNPGNPGPGFQLTEHWLTPELNNQDYPLSEQFHWERADHELLSWVRLINVTQNATLEWRFYKPDGTFYFADIVSVPNQNGGTYFAWMSMYTDIAAAYNFPGKWNVEVWGKVGNGSWNYLLAENFWIGYEMNTFQMCKSITNDNNGAPIPINQKNTFYCSDQEANHWLQLTNVTEEIDVKVDWIEPNGSVFYSGTSQGIPHPSTQNYDWWDYWNIFYGFPISGQPAGNRTGDWKVKVYAKYPGLPWVHQYTDNFQILESSNINPVASVSINHQNPVEGDNLTISFSATDNKYLKKTIRYHRINDGTWQSATQNNINSNSWSKNVNIGVLSSGDKLEYYTVAIDNSGNSHTSNLGIVIIQDDDLFPPSISNLTVSEYNGNGDGSIDDLEQYEVCATISDDSGISSVTFLIDGVPISLTSNYCAIVNSSNSGNHVFQVEATDIDNSPLSSYNSLVYFIYESCPSNLFVNTSIDGTYESSNNITTNGSIQINNNQNIIYKSQSINLKPGIHAQPGSVFRAHVDPCNN